MTRDTSTGAVKNPSKTRVPRIIYNDDTCSLRYLPQPHTKEKVHIAVDYLRGSQVDVFCWCMCTQVAYSYRSQKVENYFDLMKQNGPEWAMRRDHDLMASLDAQGIDYLPILIDRTHGNGMRFFASFRMNDCHHRSMPECALTSEFWKQHQQYRLWEVTDALSYYNGLLDYSYEPVRRRMLDMIFEVADKYDIDGVELDMGREPYYFQPSEAWRKRGILTEFVKTVRGKLNRLGKQRGKEIQLLIRTPYDEQRLKLGGMDVWTWIRRGYLDILAMNSRTCQNDYNQRVEPYLGLCRKAGVLFYPSIENGPLANVANYPSAVKVPHNFGPGSPVPEIITSQRAMASNLLEQDVDGLHFFNYQLFIFEAKTFFAKDQRHYRMLKSALSELGERKTLAGTDKTYFFFNDLPIYAESRRPKEFNQTVAFTVFGHDIKRAKQVTLSFRQMAKRNPHAPGPCPDTSLAPRGYVDYYLNGQKVSMNQVRMTVKAAGPIQSGFVLDQHHLVEIDISPRNLRDGENTIAFEIPRFPQMCDPYVYFYELKAEVVF